MTGRRFYWGRTRRPFRWATSANPYPWEPRCLRGRRRQVEKGSSAPLRLVATLLVAAVPVSKVHLGHRTREFPAVATRRATIPDPPDRKVPDYQTPARYLAELELSDFRPLWTKTPSWSTRRRSTTRSGSLSTIRLPIEAEAEFHLCRRPPRRRRIPEPRGWQTRIRRHPVDNKSFICIDLSIARDLATTPDRAHLG